MSKTTKARSSARLTGGVAGMNAWDEVRNAIAAGKAARDAIELHSNAMTDLLMDSLEHVSPYRLIRLKAKLRRFDASKKKWKP